MDLTRSVSCIHNEQTEHDACLKDKAFSPYHTIFYLACALLCLGSVRKSLGQSVQEEWWTSSRVLLDQKSQRATCRHEYFSSLSTLQCNSKPSRVLRHGSALQCPVWLRSSDGSQTQTLMGCHRRAVQTQGWAIHARLLVCECVLKCEWLWGWG